MNIKWLVIVLFLTIHEMMVNAGNSTADNSEQFYKANGQEFGLYNNSDLTTDYYYDYECYNLSCMTYEELVRRIRAEVLTPSTVEWIFIVAHSIVFFVGLIGNALVCVAVYRNHSMRTVTNYFIVNLAVADFMVILFCLPPTVVWDITDTWFFGVVLCKVVLYVQTVSVAVSVLTLTFISIDRWYAICYPLKFKSTTGRAKTAIAIIWFIALSADIPELAVLTTIPNDQLNITEVYYTQCDVDWSYKTDTIWNISKTIVFYIIPLIFMSFAYYQIVRVLWRTDQALHFPNTTSAAQLDQQPRHNHSNQRNNGSSQGYSATSKRSTFIMNTNASTEGQLRSRRKAAKMLCAVVAMFGFCCLPVHLLNILRPLVDLTPNDFNKVAILFSHWLMYANSAVNPIIYNFMSGKFRKEFHSTFGFWCCQNRNFNRRRQTTLTRSSTYMCRFTTGNTSMNTRPEVVPLSQFHQQYSTRRSLQLQE